MNTPHERRIATEHRIVRKTVATFLNAGYLLNVDNGGDEMEVAEPTANQTEILEHLLATSDARLFVYRPGQGEWFGWVWFVYGNDDGSTVIADYTTNLEAVLEPINAYADSQEAKS
jgi:hypothetical protein